MHNTIRSLYIIGLFCTLLILSACGGSSSASGADAAGRLNVVATTGHIADALANIGGDAIALKGLLGPGVDPHLYVPTESNVADFADADIIVYNGLHLEAQMARVFEQMAGRGVTVLGVGDELPTDALLTWEANTPYDPHIWNDPELWSQAVEIMRDTLIEADPANETLYRENTDAYLAEIAETAQYVRDQIERIPEDKRVMITAHDAFAYFGRAFGIEVMGLQGISTESEASTADVQNLAQFIAERQIPAIFVETSVPPRTIEAVQAAVQAQGFDVQIGGSLYSDALGETGSGAETYVGMLRANAATVASALGGN